MMKEFVVTQMQLADFVVDPAKAIADAEGPIFVFDGETVLFCATSPGQVFVPVSDHREGLH